MSDSPNFEPVPPGENSESLESSPPLGNARSLLSVQLLGTKTRPPLGQATRQGLRIPAHTAKATASPPSRPQVQRSPVAAAPPESWSSLADLMAQTTAHPLQRAPTPNSDPNNPKSQHQNALTDFHTSNLLPPGVQKGVYGLKSLGFLEQAAAVSQLSRQSLQAETQLKKTIATAKAKPIEPIQKSEATATLTPTNSAITTISSTSQTSNSENSDLSKRSDYMDLLAREIYGLLRQRFSLERERQGSYTTGRSPW